MNLRLKRSVITILIAFGIGVAAFLMYAERWLCAEGRNRVRAADALVVLAGSGAEDRDRLATGVQLMHRKVGRFMILPLRHASFTWAWAVSHYDLSEPADADRIIIGHAPGTDMSNLSRYGGTYIEAFKTAQIMRRRHLTSAVIVTSAYHMRRARLAFEHFQPSHRLTFFYHAVDPSSPRRTPWWLDRTYFFKILNEYKKLIAATLLYEPPPLP